ANRNLYGSVSVLLGDGKGGFATAKDTGVGSMPTELKVGEFNGDGVSDLAVINQYSPVGGVPAVVSILTGDGFGNFARADFDAAKKSSGPFSVAVGDFNGDGVADLVTANSNTPYSGNTISILLGNAGTLDAIDGPVTIDGGAGANRLSVND